MAFKLFRSSSESEPRESRERTGREDPAGGSQAPANPAEGGSAGVRALSSEQPEELPAGSGLPEIVALMDRYGVRTLRLDQHGNEMTALMDPSEKPERKTTVDTESTWFDAVASLYTAAQAGPRGPWRRAEVMVGTARDGRRPVEVEYTYPGSERQDRSAYAQTVSERSSGEDSGAASVAESEPEAPAETPAAQSSAAAGSAPAVEGTGSGSDGGTADVEVLGVPAAQESGVGAPAESPRADRAETAAADPARADSAASDSASSGDQPQVAAQDSRGAADGDPEDTPDRAEQTGSFRAVDAEPPVPAVVPDSTWDEERQTGREHRVEDALPDSAPSVAEHADVAPSYHAPAQTPAKPSDTRLAPGNLVLTEAQVVSRLAEAQQALFGPQGTARDVSTVLIRVRALGSYYDALTHVRGNGLWDQRSTFQLVPEEALQVLSLKEDSYQEGQGSPIAMMFRFTPGIPPEVSFDYADEERYVQYRDRLPAQQYVEELRMYPRTGSNIPEHMNEALTQWSL